MPPRKRQRTEKQAGSDPQRPDRNPASRSAPAGPDGDDTSRSVLGGMAGGWRVTGEEPTSGGSGITGFKVPFEDKAIVCQLYHSQCASNDGDIPKLIFTHGAGGGLANPATADFAKGFAHAVAILCYQGTMNLRSRVKTFKAVADHVQSQHHRDDANKDGGATRPETRLALGGRSMGGRAACIAAQQIDNVDALVLVSYPLTSGKGSEGREQPLYDLPASTQVLFISGDQDKMCHLKDLADVRNKMSAQSSLCIVKSADHAMSVKGGKDQIEAVRKKTGNVAAKFLAAGQERAQAADCVVEVAETEGGFEIKSSWDRQRNQAEPATSQKRGRDEKKNAMDAPHKRVRKR